MFYSENFIFDGKKSSEYGVILVSSENSVLNEYGTSFESNLISDKSLTSIEEVVFDEEITTNTMELRIALVDENHLPIPWTVKKRNEILGWLVQDNFKAFSTEDEPEVLYYLKCVGVKKEFAYDLTGMLVLTMKPISPYAYTPIVIEKHKTVKGEIEFIINNPSNISKKYYPEIEITSLGEGEHIQIFNTVLGGTPFSITNLKDREVVVIDGLLKTVFNQNGESKLTDCNREWLKLIRGQNLIKIKGNCEISIKCQYPILV